MMWRKLSTLPAYFQTCQNKEKKREKKYPVLISFFAWSPLSNAIHRRSDQIMISV